MKWWRAVWIGRISVLLWGCTWVPWLIWPLHQLKSANDHSLMLHRPSPACVKCGVLLWLMFCPLFINDCTRCQHPVTDVFLSINSVHCFHWAVFVQYYWECLMLRASVVLCTFQHSIRRDCYDSFHNFSMLLLFCVAFLSIWCYATLLWTHQYLMRRTMFFTKRCWPDLANDPTTVASVCLCFLTADNVLS